MNTGLIIRREYFTRVKSKSFIITTLLVPILLVLVFGIIIYLTVSSKSEKNIAVVDEGQFFNNKLKSTSSLHYDFVPYSIDSAKKLMEAKKFDAVIHIPSFSTHQSNSFNIYSDEQLGMTNQTKIESAMNEIIEDSNIAAAGIEKSVLENIKKQKISLVQKIGKEEKESDNKIAHYIAYASGMLLYFLMVIYGMSVMRSVMEEKTNRIAEIIISSVKPFELMMGKIVGVALVGLTQFAIWIILIGVALLAITVGMGASGIGSNPEALQQAMELQSQMGTGDIMASQIPMNEDIQGFFKVMNDTNWTKIILWFLFYFLGGYFLYAALFAAVGSLVSDDSQESNSLTMPVTMPIFIAFIIMINALNDPNSGTAIFGSIFPLTSPIVMMARIPFNAPTALELIASVVCLIGGFILTTALAAKIYRTGILLHGKKITYKEIGKWIFNKG